MDVLHQTATGNGFDSQGAAQLPEPTPLGKDYGQVSVGEFHLRDRPTGGFSRPSPTSRDSGHRYPGGAAAAQSQERDQCAAAVFRCHPEEARAGEERIENLLNRKLVALDVVLAAAIVFGGWEWRSQWLAARARQAGMPGPAPRPTAVKGLAPLVPPPAVMPSKYLDVAQKDLSDPSPIPIFRRLRRRSRNPSRCRLRCPRTTDRWTCGDPQGPVALITDKDSQGYMQVHAKEPIGEFTLVSFNRQEMILDWRGKEIAIRTKS